MSGSTIRVGLIGLGRSGWDIHAATIERMPERFKLAAVTDPSAERCAEAERRTGCRTVASVEALVNDAEVELVAVTSPNRLHAEHAIAALRAGRDVVCEKPFAADTAEADRVIAAAKEAGRCVAPFQNRRYEPLFGKVREVIASGVLGRIVQIRCTFHGFSRRWDWQTLKRLGGGTLNNAGAHFMDQALQLFGEDEPEEVFAHLDNALSFGDADDHVSVMLRSPGAPLVQVELSSACAFPQQRWLVMGTRGGLTADGDRAEWKWFDPEALPHREVLTEPTPDRSYNREEIPWQRDAWEAGAEAGSMDRINEAFYADLYAALREGAPLVVTPESVRRQIAVLERCHAQAGGPAADA